MRRVQKHKIGSLGEVVLQAPNSIATCYDFLTLWTSEPDKARLLRLCASAIAACCPAFFSPYPLHTGDPVAWGAKNIDRLYSLGVEMVGIYTIGSACLLMMSKHVIPEEEVAALENFTEEKEEASI